MQTRQKITEFPHYGVVTDWPCRNGSVGFAFVVAYKSERSGGVIVEEIR